MWIHNGHVIAKQLNALMGNIYKNNAAKLGAWVTASHVERPNKKKETTPAPTPT